MAINLADPDLEPTDEELQQLSRDAFAEVPKRNAEALARVRRQISAAGEEALAQLEKRRGAR